MKRWLMAVVVCMAMYGVLSGQAWPNPNFTTNLCPWWVIHEYEAGTGDIIIPGTVEHSTYFGGSAHLTVSGGPSVIGLMNFTEQTLSQGDTIKMRVEHTGTVGFGSISLRVGGGPAGEVEVCPTSAGEYIVNLVLSQTWQPGTPVWTHFVVWPGNAEAWIDYIGYYPTKVDEREKKREDFNAPKWNVVPNIKHEGQVSIFLILSESSPVSLKVYDLGGRLIKTLAKGTFRKGSYNFLWDHKNQNENSNPSGLYFVHLETETPKFSETKKIIVVK